MFINTKTIETEKILVKIALCRISAGKEKPGEDIDHIRKEILRDFIPYCAEELEENTESFFQDPRNYINIGGKEPKVWDVVENLFDGYCRAQACQPLNKNIKYFFLDYICREIRKVSLGFCEEINGIICLNCVLKDFCLFRKV